MDFQKLIIQEQQKPYYIRLNEYLKNAYNNDRVYPMQKDIFRALQLTPLESVRVVILGQDPYYKQGQACGLCFGVNNNVAIPKSLANIFKAIKYDIGIDSICINGDLTAWASQGVLLINTVLTVSEGKPLSHAKFGWQNFTDEVIKLVNDLQHRVVFLLWGNAAISKKELLNNSNHLILTSSHPSPLSAYKGFYTCKHFSQTNKFLSSDGVHINW